MILVNNNCDNKTLSMRCVVLPKQKTTDECNQKMNKIYLAEASAVGLCGLAFLAYRGYSNSYKVKLARDLSKELGEKITTKNLKSIMSKSELLKELPKLTEQNYVASENNIKNGVFLADLHSHSNFSDGQISVESLLNQATEYGNKLKKLNGKKFIFALSDHDGIDGVKEAIKIIAKNPDKYKNIKFVPAAEVSFVLPCQKNSIRYKKFNSDVQMPEVLVYGINPFSENSKNFFEGIHNSRNKQINDAISDYSMLSTYSREEYDKFFNPKNKKLCFLNQHWKIWNYVHTKSRIIEIAKEQNVKPNVLYEKIFNEMETNKKSMTPHELDNYIKNKNIQTNSKMFDEGLKWRLLNKIFPLKIDEKTVKTDYELQLSDIAKYAKKENLVIGFAHPGFTIQNFCPENQLERIQDLIKQCNGHLKLAEKYHQKYPIGKDISTDELKQYNSILDKLDLINIGGRDNHSKNFI